MNSQFTNKYILLWGMEFINAVRSEKCASSLAEFCSYRKDEVEGYTSEYFCIILVERFFGAEGARKVVLSRCEHCLHCLNYLHC